MLPSLRRTTISSLLLLTSLVTALDLDCKDVQVDKRKWDLSKLGGPYSILVQDTEAHPSKRNTTWTIDICQALKKPKDVPKDDACPNGTRVCGITKSWNPVDDPEAEHPVITDVIGVAGQFLQHGGSLDPKITRLKTSDQDREGIDIELHGGRYNDQKQKAVVSFICDVDWEGTEGKQEKTTNSPDRREKRDDEDDGVDPADRYKQDPKNALQFVSYGGEDVSGGRMDVLRLNWKTKYACEKASDGDNSSPSKEASWGFFTWFILILFLSIAAYLIFGSWLNYNRYGARGWDLLPHGDTIRDVPYLFKDWSRKVIDTVTGSHSRGINI